MQKIRRAFGLLTFLGSLSYSIAADALPAIPQGGELVFFGDSITAYGDRPGGWVQNLRETISSELGRPDIEIINAGEGGNTVADLHRRFLWRTWAKPELVVVCIGINDARFADWHGYEEGDLREYREGLDGLVKKLKATGASVLVLSPIVTGEQQRGRNALDSIIDAYLAAASEVAVENQAPFLDLRSLFFKKLAEANPGDQASGIFTHDGLHLSAAGNALVAEAVLRKLKSLPPSTAL